MILFDHVRAWCVKAGIDPSRVTLTIREHTYDAEELDPGEPATQVLYALWISGCVDSKRKNAARYTLHAAPSNTIESAIENATSRVAYHLGHGGVV